MALIPPVVSRDQAIANARTIIAYGPTYSMQNRGTYIGAPSFDCSSFVGTCYNVPGRPATPGMPSIYAAYGFKVLPFIGLGSLKRGDVLVYNGPAGGAGADGHTAMYIGDGLFAEASGGEGPGSGGHYSAAYAGVHGSIWQTVLRPFSLYIKKWQPSDRINDGWEKV